MTTGAHSTNAPSWSLGVDVGGTVTDAVVASGDGVFTAKVPTTPGDQSEGVMAAVRVALDRAALEPHEVASFGHGMTVATNALLEERGARTALLATEGFTDVLEIARQTRPELYRPCAARPAALVPAELRFGVAERVTPGGVLRELDLRALDEALARLAEAQVESVAVCLLHSYARPEHERRVARSVADRLPGVHVSASHDLVSVFREYERTSTTVIDAYLSPLLSGYLERLAARAADAGLPEPEIMRSSGGVMSAGEAGRHAAWTVLSGPAAGAVGAALAGNNYGSPDVLSLDMGGTSCDVAVIDGGVVRESSEHTIAGRTLQLPMVDVHTVGAGGGSIGWHDAGGALRVGPRSAGALPGPACYGRGGEEPTVTDANLLLGYLSADATLAAGVQLDRDAAERAVGRLADGIGLSIEETARGIVRIADEEMLRALRVATVERGVDPRRYALVAFGGAGPMHAARLAEELEISKVLCPRAAGVLSALGLASADRRRDAVRTVLMSEEDVRAGRAETAVRELAAQAQAGLGGATLEATWDVRYAGQAFELPIEAPADAGPDMLRKRFEHAHAERYGYADPEGALEIVTLHVSATAARPVAVAARGVAAAERARRSERMALFGERWLTTTVVRGAPPPGERLDGPAVFELDEATVVVPPGWRVSIDELGTLAMERGPGQ
jgi:N-methylhydantoinase A